MRTAKLSWVLFVLALFFVGPVQAQDKKKGAKKEKTVVYQGKTLEQWIEALKDKDVNVRREAAEALGELGEKAVKAVPALTQALKDKDEKVRKAAKEALEKIQKK